MNYMLDKINLLANGTDIIKKAQEIVDMLVKDDDFTDSERLMVIELAVAKLNYELYNISGDGDE